MLTKKILDLRDLSQSFVTEDFAVRNNTGFSIIGELTGAPAGTLKIQVSNDNIFWQDLDDSERAITAEAQITYNVNKAFYFFVRMIWTAEVGSVGIGNAIIQTKGT